MKVTDLTSLYQHQLKDLFSVEKQLAQALTKLAEAATNEQLKQLFQEHQEETVAQGERIAELLKNQSVSGTRHKCKGIAGIIEEGEEIIALEAGEDKADVKDAGLIGAAQRAEHYEMAAYGTAAALAGQLQLTEDQKVLKEILEQERAADKKLTALATGEVNQEAEDAGATTGESSDTKKSKGQKAMRRDEYGYNQGQGGRDQEYGQYSQRGGQSSGQYGQSAGQYGGNRGSYDRDEYDRGGDESGRYSTSGRGSYGGQGQYGGNQGYGQGQYGGGSNYGQGQYGSNYGGNYGNQGGNYGNQGGNYGGQGQYGSSYGNQGSNYGGQGQYGSSYGNQGGSYGGQGQYGGGYGNQGNYGQSQYGGSQGYGQGGGRGEYGSDDYSGGRSGSSYGRSNSGDESYGSGSSDSRSSRYDDDDYGSSRRGNRSGSSSSQGGRNR